MTRHYKIPYTRRDFYRSELHQRACQRCDKTNAEEIKENHVHSTQKNGDTNDLLSGEQTGAVNDSRVVDRNYNKDVGMEAVKIKHNKAQSTESKKEDGCKPDEMENQLLLGKARNQISLPSHTVDCVDYIRNTDKFSAFDFVIYLFSLCSYFADIGTDIWVAYLYFTQGHIIWFGLTVSFILIPAIVVSLFSLVWYYQDHKHSSHELNNVSKLQWTSRTICLLLQIGLVIRYIECLLYGVRSKKDRHWYNMLAFEDTDSTLLRLLECFLESTPQLTLQLYIIMTLGLNDGWLLVVVQTLSCLTSLGSVSWGLVSYHRALRYSLSNKANVTYGGMALQFFWRFFTVGSRVLTLAMFAAVYKYWTFVAISSHWIVMFIWILSQRTKFCDTKCQEFFFNIVMATVYIFCYLNILDGHTRLRYVFFYITMYLENTALVMAWYAFAGTSSDWYITPVMVAVFIGPCIGLMFMMIYYLCCHPNNLSPEFSDVQIKICVPWSDLYLCQLPVENNSDVASHVQSHELQDLGGSAASHV